MRLRWTCPRKMNSRKQRESRRVTRREKGKVTGGGRKKAASPLLLLLIPVTCTPRSALSQHHNPTPPSTTMDADYLLTLEERFYQEGLDSGTPHGQLHGLFEGRALGREKGWELWEEVGYYEGVAKLWKAVLVSQGKEGGRCGLSWSSALCAPHSISAFSLQSPSECRPSPHPRRLLSHRQRLDPPPRNVLCRQRGRRHSRPPQGYSRKVPHGSGKPWHSREDRRGGSAG